MIDRSKISKPLTILVVGSTLLAASFLSAASVSAADNPPRRLIVCSTTQTADFSRQVVGDRWEVQSILKPGTDPHLYQITQADARLVAKADLCVENGWHLEGKDWMRTLAEDENKPLVTCTDGIAPLELLDDGQKVKDPHAWFSPQNAARYVQNIASAVIELDPDNADEHHARTQLYLAQLRALHGWCLQQFNSLPADQRVLVTNHDAFNYFCKQYNMKAASPVGWSTGSEVGGGLTPERRKQTVNSIRKFGVRSIFVETTIDGKVMRQIAQDAGVRIGGKLYSDSMGIPGSAGETYLGMMRENVLIIVQGLK